jgi:hypothetical protein
MIPERFFMVARPAIVVKGFLFLVYESAAVFPRVVTFFAVTPDSPLPGLTFIPTTIL